jgi:phytol kinase
MIIFVMHKSTVEYLIPILVLTFADSIAALVGKSYGRNSLADVQEDHKSSEGSIMFFITAFICVLVPLQLMTEVGRAEVLVISFLIGLLAAMIEAVSRNGNDNLLLPLLVYSFLRYNMSRSLDALIVNFGVMLVFFVIILFVYKATTISRLSAAYALLSSYVILIQGGFRWILPPLAGLVTFGTLPMMGENEKNAQIPVQVLDANAMIGQACLWISVFFPQYLQILYPAFSLSFACHLTLNTYHRFYNYLNLGRSPAILAGLAKSVVFIALPTIAIAQMDWRTTALYLLFLAAAVPPGLYLRKKIDFTTMNIVSARANETLVGAIVAAFAVIGGVIGGLI